MTREEAIHRLAFMQQYYTWRDGEIEALDMAIEALKREDAMLKEIERVVLYGERGEVNE